MSLFNTLAGNSFVTSNQLYTLNKEIVTRNQDQVSAWGFTSGVTSFDFQFPNGVYNNFLGATANFPLGKYFPNGLIGEQYLAHNNSYYTYTQMDFNHQLNLQGDPLNPQYPPGFYTTAPTNTFGITYSSQTFLRSNMEGEATSSIPYKVLYSRLSGQRGTTLPVIIDVDIAATPALVFFGASAINWEGDFGGNRTPTTLSAVSYARQLQNMCMGTKYPNANWFYAGPSGGANNPYPGYVFGGQHGSQFGCTLGGTISRIDPAYDNLLNRSSILKPDIGGFRITHFTDARYPGSSPITTTHCPYGVQTDVELFHIIAPGDHQVVVYLKITPLIGSIGVVQLSFYINAINDDVYVYGGIFPST